MEDSGRELAGETRLGRTPREVLEMKAWVAAALFVVVLARSDSTAACFEVELVDAATVVVEIAGFGLVDVYLALYPKEFDEGCRATLVLPSAQFASHRRLPSPGDLARAVGRVAERMWDARTCSVIVVAFPDDESDWDERDYRCTRGEIARDRGGWVSAGADRDCD